MHFIWVPNCGGRTCYILRGFPKRGGRNCSILHGSLSVVAQSAEAYGVGVRFATSDLWWPKVSHFTSVPKGGGRKCRILHGSLSVVAESVVFYMGPSAWWPTAPRPMGYPSGSRPLTCGGRKCRNLHGSLSLVAESVVFYMGP